MFALREIVKDKLYAIADDEDDDCFNQCFDQWQDPMYLWNFFKKNPNALMFYQMSAIEAAQHVIDDSTKFQLALLNANQSGATTNYLDSLFRPLHSNDNQEIPYLQSKAYGTERPSLLRMYAIRLDDGCYIIVGGLIKVQKALQEFTAGKLILKELNKLSHFLVTEKLKTSDDLGEFLI